ncbi:D-alanyl-D-alanine carboxypeptidase family protein [Pseudonocardia endophytica]|uniref:D-alanyl-D-alanine carboxypeptidase (Penicillin-binding protein 5/6) n=1 Tax=Pseudonocardia endophytica TaxID=401976 RepID=A0A4R1HHS3_PSEEN|nr:serine hydrolase [Pseudonocardia endophytica]TCK20451.1 D-alanyl-D-alanine carboxypeptidase (penicillin-binding protein 5/6) [Pseudonocardia endophytica]
MRARAVAVTVALTAALLAGSAAPALAAAPTAPAAAPCPGQAAPPGPPADEETVPVTPLPVPDQPVGGPGMGTCGEVRSPGTAPPPPVGVASYVVADLDSGAVLAARAPHARERPASTLKMLLSLVVTDRLDPSTVVVGTPEDANVDGSRAGVGPGGRYTVDQLFHGLILNSGNDTANALARTMGGIPATLAAMQSEARTLGALDTRPATVSGLDGPGMSSSAYDLALFFRAVAQRPRITTVMHTRTYPFPGFADKPGFLTSNDDPLLDTPGFIGGKTGFTDAARHTFAGGVDRNGRRLVVVIMRGEQHPVRMVDQAKALLDWGFATPRTAAPVGTLVDPAPTPPSDTATPAQPAPAAAASSTASTVAIAAGALALLTVVALLVLRRRRRKA